MTLASPGGGNTARAAEVNDVRARMLRVLLNSRLPFMVGGAYGFYALTGIARFTKDFDVFIHPRDCDAVLSALAGGGYPVEATFPHWLGKAFADDAVLDVIWGAGNGMVRIDDGWFAHAIRGQALGLPIYFCPAEETIWSKAFIMERERFDGGDVVHLIQARADTLDWRRLLDRFGPHWRILLAHLVLFGFVFPGERSRVPAWVLRSLTERLAAERFCDAGGKLCQGTLLSREQYLVDVECKGYEDARRPPRGTMTTDDIARWTAAIQGRDIIDGLEADAAGEGDRPAGGRG